jgi:hypothetical protein
MMVIYANQVIPLMVKPILGIILATNTEVKSGRLKLRFYHRKILITI